MASSTSCDLTPQELNITQEVHSDGVNYPETVVITNANVGCGFELIDCFLNCPSPPRLLFAACKRPSDRDRAHLQYLAIDHKCIKYMPMSSTNDDEIDILRGAVDYMIGTSDGLNLLINNAGMVPKLQGARLEDQTLEDLHTAFDDNVVAPILVTKSFLPVLTRAAAKRQELPKGCGRAAVINVFSQVPCERLATQFRKLYPYRAARAALTVLTSEMSRELKEAGLLVALVHPPAGNMGDKSTTAMAERETMFSDMLATILNLRESNSGLSFHYDGMVLPF